MREYMKNYIDLIDIYINKENYKDIEEVIDNHIMKISFFQHERLIHLLVTIFYAVITLLILGLTMLSYIFIPIAIIIMIFLILYIIHYFYLENGVQYMYKQYDKLKELDK